MYIIGSPSELQIFHYGTYEECERELKTHRQVYDELREMFPDFGIYEESGFYADIPL